MPDLTGRVAVVTGANSGLGYETARVLAAHGAHVVLAVRDETRGRTAAAEIERLSPGARVSVEALDLASLSSVHRAASRLRDQHPRIDLLVNNAGVMYVPPSTTEDGVELQFGVNHLGHFALTGLLLDRMVEVDGSRVVTVSSLGHRVRAEADFEDAARGSGSDRVAAYGRSKLANLLFTYELQARLAAAGVETVALAAHPGASTTELVRNSPAVVRVLWWLARPLAQSAAKGALPTLRAATDPDALGGQYYGPDGWRELRGHPVVVRSSKASHDPELRRDLWAVSEAVSGVQYPI